MHDRRRIDHPGTFHHVTNRGLAHRPTFETVDDVRFWLYLMAQCTRRGWLEIHAYCLMTTHFHMLVRSLLGQLSHAMQWSASQFTRAFNRRRGRDGPVWKSRFYSRPVSDPADRHIVTRYIDRNPVEAGLVEGVCDWPHGSAWHYARPSGPLWLTRNEVEAGVCATLGLEAYDPTRYEEVYGRSQRFDECWLVERRIETRSTTDVPTTASLTPDWARDRMVRHTVLADGSRPSFPLAAPDSLLAAISLALPQGQPLLVGKKRHRTRAADVLTAGLLRSGAGLTFQEIAARVGCAPSTIQRRYAMHCDLLESDEPYAALAALAFSNACPEPLA